MRERVTPSRRAASADAKTARTHPSAAQQNSGLLQPSMQAERRSECARGGAGRSRQPSCLRRHTPANQSRSATPSPPQFNILLEVIPVSRAGRSQRRGWSLLEGGQALLVARSSAARRRVLVRAQVIVQLISPMVTPKASSGEMIKNTGIGRKKLSPTRTSASLT